MLDATASSASLSGSLWGNTSGDPCHAATEAYAERLARLFPLLEEMRRTAAEGRDGSQAAFAYLDNAATTQKPAPVLEVLNRFYVTQNSNVHRALYPLASQATESFEAARATVADSLGFGSGGVIFTSGTTSGLNYLSLGLESAIGPRDVVVVSELEHHSNLLPWMRLCERTGARLEWLSVFDDGGIDLEQGLELLKTSQVKILALTGLSHVLGNQTPVRELFQAAQACGTFTVLDAAQYLLHDSTSLEICRGGLCDAVVFSGHKVFAPTGIGVLALSPRLIGEMRPVILGGGMVGRIRRGFALNDVEWREAPHTFEGGTPPIEAAVALAEAFRFVRTPDFLMAQGQARSLVDQLARRLAEREDVELYGWARAIRKSVPLAPHGGILSFNLRGQHPHDVAQAFADGGVAVRAGAHCAQPLMERLGCVGTVRVSFAAYNTRRDLDLFCEVLQSIQPETGGRFSGAEAEVEPGPPLETRF